MSLFTLNKSRNHITREDENFENLYLKNNSAKPEVSNESKLLKHFFDINTDFNINGWEYFRNELEFE